MAVTGTPTTGNDFLISDDAADSIDALAGTDVLVGNGGNDTLNGGAGDDSMSGDAGDDLYIVDSTADVVSESSTTGGTDTVRTSVSFALGANIENLIARSATGGQITTGVTLTGNTLANSITGSNGADVLFGGDESSVAGGAGAVDTLVGGQGNDTYIIRGAGDDVITELGDDAVAGTAGGTDTATVVASATRTSFTLGGAAGTAAVENLVASEAASELSLDLTGNGFTQTIVGNAGVNTLSDGGTTVGGAQNAPADTLIGLGGNDIYTVSTGNTVVQEADGGGFDIVNITAAGNATNSNAANAGGTNIAGGRDFIFTGASVEQITAAAAGTGFLNITGSASSQRIDGNAGSNVLNGNGGTDTLTGLGGADTYVVDGVEDIVVEAAGGGTDRVIAQGNYVLNRTDATGTAVAQNIELLTAGGTTLSTRTGQGNGTFDLNALNANTALNNFLVGDSTISEQIFGSAGNNILDGFSTNGNDAPTAALTGPAAATLVGLGGSDTYRVYDQTDVVVEDTAGGFDWIYTSASYSLLTNDTNARGASFTDEDGVTRTFGGAPNTGGNVGATYLGAAGPLQIEILSAARQNSADVAIDLTGNTFGQIIVGNFAANTLSDGGDTAAGGSVAAGTTGSSVGTSQDQLAGLRGNDTYNVTAQSTLVNEDAGNGTDTVNVLYAAQTGAGTATAFGGTYGLIAAAEVEFLNAGIAGVGVSLFGNGFNQVITGNTGNDALNGGGGQDTLVGGAGNDVYTIDAGNVSSITIIERTADDVAAVPAGPGGVPGATPASGIDRVNTSVSFDLANDNAAFTGSGGAVAAGGVVSIEQIVVTNGAGTDAINLAGNGFAQLIVGNFGNNAIDGDNDTRNAQGVLTGTAAGDTMQGLGGNDSYRVYSQADVVLESDGLGTDVVFSSAAYTLYAGQSIESLSAANQSSTAGLLLSGNELAQTVGIIGTNGADTLYGRGGNDVLIGRGGSDTFAFAETGAGNADTINDFAPGDFIGLQNTTFAGVGATLDAGEFVVGTAAQDADDRIIYNQTTGEIFYDADGNGAVANAVLFARVVPGTALGFNDFTVLTTAAPTIPTF